MPNTSQDGPQICGQPFRRFKPGPVTKDKKKTRPAKTLTGENRTEDICQRVAGHPGMHEGERLVW